MIGRMSFLYVLTPEALAIVAAVGIATAIFSATIGFDPERHQESPGLLHREPARLHVCGHGRGRFLLQASFTSPPHAFFKALLFLGAGSVIHGLSGEQDMRKMGGLSSRMPITFMTMLAAWLAIAGIFPFAGFVSKDEILWKAFSNSVHATDV